MKKYIIGILIIVFLIVGCFYFVFSRDENLTITYIKFKANPEFVIGINNKDKVIMYNPLNEEAGMFNLEMFRNKTLEDVSNIFIDKLNENNYLINKEVNLTVMTKNLEKRNQIYKMVNDVIARIDNTIVVNILEPTSDELLAFSNEEVFDIKPTLNENNLITIGSDIRNQIDIYIKEKISNLKLDKISLEEQKIIIENNFNLGYFNDFVVSNSLVNYDIILSNRSSYNIEFIFNEDLTYSYNIILDLEFDYYKEIIKNDIKVGEVEVYKYKIDSLSVISDYKNHYYRFNY